MFTRLGQNSVSEGQGRICASAFDYGKTNVICERGKKKKEEEKRNGKHQFPEPDPAAGP